MIKRAKVARQKASRKLCFKEACDELQAGHECVCIHNGKRFALKANGLLTANFKTLSIDKFIEEYAGDVFRKD